MVKRERSGWAVYALGHKQASGLSYLEAVHLAKFQPRLTYTSYGAHLSDSAGFVTHELWRSGSGWMLYTVVSYGVKRYLGSYATLEEAVNGRTKA